MLEENNKTPVPSPVEEARELAVSANGIKYPHLYLSEWPFQTVPDERFSRIWADRRAVLEDIYFTLNYLSRRKTSTINLIFAWYGAGKSHTLKHMFHLCHKKFNSLLPIYTEYPKTVKSFFDLYVYFVSELGVDFIADVGVELLSGKNAVEMKRKLLIVSSDFVSVLELLSRDETLAKRWIMGEKLPRALLSKHGIGKRIETSDDAVKAASFIIKMLELSGRASRVLWMIDEFQRVGTERRTVLEDINTGLHSVFNACPNSLSLLLSFSVKHKKDMFSYLSKELIDRVGIQRVLEIPKMSQKDALTFISDLLFEFRPNPDETPSAYFPFNEDAVQYIIGLIDRSSELKPRSIMQYFNAVLEAAEARIARGEMREITMDFAKSILSDYDLFLSFQKESLAGKER